MTIMRHQIRCLVPENDAIVIVIEDGRDSLTFQCTCAQEWFAHAHQVKELRCEPCWTDMPETTTITHQLVLTNLFVNLRPNVHPNSLFCQGLVLSSNENIHSPSSTHPTSLIVFICDELNDCGENAGVHVPSLCLLYSLSLTSDTLDFAFPLPFPKASDACASSQLPCVCTLRSFDTHPRSTKVSLQLVHRSPCLCGLLCLSSHLSCPLPNFHCPFPFREMASTSIGSSSCVFASDVVLKGRLLLE